MLLGPKSDPGWGEGITFVLCISIGFFGLRLLSALCGRKM